MPSAASPHDLRAKVSAHGRRYHKRRYLVLGVLVALSLVVAGIAYAGTPYAYYAAFANPGVPHSSDGWNDRDHNRVCRNDASTFAHGYVRAVDYNGSGVNVHDVQGDSQCQLGIIVRIEVNGYFLTRCWNWDVVGMYLYCQTTRP